MVAGTTLTFVIVAAIVAFAWLMFRKISDWLYYIGIGAIVAAVAAVFYYFFK